MNPAAWRRTRRARWPTGSGPKSLAEVVGQEHLLGPEGPIGRMVAAGRPHSIILWGPPGTGKTTIARLLSSAFKLHFEQLSAVFSGVADLKKTFEAARTRRKVGQGTLLFIDEIHRFNRSQQDSFLPVVEDGTIVLVGATTENPSFELNGALLSRAQVLVLRRLDDAALEKLLERVETHYGEALKLAPDARATMRAMADGDGRYLLNLAEEVASLKIAKPLDPAGLMAAVQRRMPLYDKSREEHYNIISALHKSIRGSDPDAALYWLARMLAGGRTAALYRPPAGARGGGRCRPGRSRGGASGPGGEGRVRFPGFPGRRTGIGAMRALSGDRAEIQCRLCGAGRGQARRPGTRLADAPAHILNAPTKLMKNLGYGAGYQYDHEAENGFLRPELLSGRHGADAILHAQGYGLRARDRQAAGLLDEAAREEEWRIMQWGVVLMVALGGALGSLARYFVAGAVQPAWCRDFRSGFSWSTSPAAW